MLDDLLKSLGGDAAKFDPRKVVDLIDDLWDSREKIVEAVDFVWERRDEIGTAIEFVQDHADELIDLAKRLPELLADAGGALETAGGGAVKASNMLIGEGSTGVRELADDATDALKRCQKELTQVMKLFDRAGSKLGKLPLVGDAADPIIDGAQRLGAVADDLGAVAKRLSGVGVTIDKAGNDLGDVGGALGSSGVALQRLGGEAPKPKAKKKAAKRTRPTKATKATKSASKKTAKRKTAAK